MTKYYLKKIHDPWFIFCLAISIGLFTISFTRPNKNTDGPLSTQNLAALPAVAATPPSQNPAPAPAASVTQIDPAPRQTPPPAAPAQPPQKTVAAPSQNPVPNKIQIPKINADLPLITANTINPDKLHDLLDAGVLLYPESVLFGNPGQTIILGHSAPPTWPHIKYDHAFSLINRLAAGDLIKVTYNSKTYSYTVTASSVIEKGQNLAAAQNNSNQLILLTCWPPGKNQQRLTVQSQLVP